MRSRARTEGKKSLVSGNCHLLRTARRLSFDSLPSFFLLHTLGTEGCGLSCASCARFRTLPSEGSQQDYLPRWVFRCPGCQVPSTPSIPSLAENAGALSTSAAGRPVHCYLPGWASLSSRYVETRSARGHGLKPSSLANDLCSCLAAIGFGQPDIAQLGLR